MYFIYYAGRFCGQSRPAAIVSASNMMLVQFVSDKTLNKKGFKAAWKAVAGRLCLNSDKETLWTVMYRIPQWINRIVRR